MSPLQLILLALAALLFGLAAFRVAASRVDLVAAGLLAWVLAELLPALIH